MFKINTKHLDTFWLSDILKYVHSSSDENGNVKLDVYHNVFTDNSCIAYVSV